jgi:hypothetical protein
MEIHVAGGTDSGWSRGWPQHPRYAQVVNRIRHEPAVPYLIVVSCALGLVVARANEPIPSSSEPARRPPKSELHVLFLGNSLTASNDLPALVQSMAATAGIRLDYRAITPPGVSLEDHWRNGEGRTALAGTRWDYVVLQQGPSSRPESQLNLREWASKWADEARAHAATPTLYMVWPFRGQTDGFKLVAQSYRGAARASKALLLPAGEAWDRALRSILQFGCTKPTSFTPPQPAPT